MWYALTSPAAWFHPLDLVFRAMHQRIEDLLLEASWAVVCRKSLLTAFGPVTQDQADVSFYSTEWKMPPHGVVEMGALSGQLYVLNKRTWDAVLKYWSLKHRVNKSILWCGSSVIALETDVLRKALMLSQKCSLPGDLGTHPSHSLLKNHWGGLKSSQ